MSALFNFNEHIRLQFGGASSACSLYHRLMLFIPNPPFRQLPFTAKQGGRRLRSATSAIFRLRPSAAQRRCDGADSDKRTIWSWLAGNPRPRTVGPQSGFRNLGVIRSDAVTPIAETRTNWRCFGAPRCTCRISSTVSTGSSPSMRRRLASVPPTPSLFASSLSPGERRASSSKSVSSKCCAKARAGARARRGAPGSIRISQSTPEAIKIHRIRPADLKNAPRFPTILPKVKDFVGESPIVAHAYKNERDFLDYEFARAKVIEWGESAYAEERYICRSCSRSFSQAPLSR